MDNTFLSYACNILGHTNSGLTGTEISKYSVEFSMKFNRSIQFSDSNFSLEGQMVTKRDALKMNLKCFKDNEKFYIINELCSKPKFLQNIEAKQLKRKLIQDYAEYGDIENVDDKLDTEIINNTKHWLDEFPSVLILYSKAIENYKLKSFERNVLDEMRLALEMLLKEIFANQKSLENQLSNIGNIVSTSGGSIEYTNMFNKLLDYYCKYQNAYIKHNDKVNISEVEFIIEMTSIFMKNLVKIKKNSA
jgi:hypothetical protein